MITIGWKSAVEYVCPKCGYIDAVNKDKEDDLLCPVCASHPIITNLYNPEYCHMSPEEREMWNSEIRKKHTLGSVSFDGDLYDLVKNEDDKKSEKIELSKRVSILFGSHREKWKLISESNFVKAELTKDDFLNYILLCKQIRSSSIIDREKRYDKSSVISLKDTQSKWINLVQWISSFTNVFYRISSFSVSKAIFLNQLDKIPFDQFRWYIEYFISALINTSDVQDFFRNVDNFKLYYLSPHNDVNYLNLSNNDITIWVYRSLFDCHSQKHLTESVTAIVTSLKEERVRINVTYCRNCNRFYINETSLTNYENIYGTLLFHRKPHKSMGEYRNEWGRAPQSQLYLYGYNVKKDGASDEERHLLLYTIISNGWMTKSSIESHLIFLIRTNGEVENNYNARNRWYDDLTFVQQLNIDEQPLLDGTIKE